MVTDDEAPFVQQHAYGSLPSTSDVSENLFYMHLSAMNRLRVSSL